MRADARANRQDLLAAASTLLQEQGAGMSLRAVAQAAGVGVGTLYRHFPSRSELLGAVVDEMAGLITGIMTRFLEGDGEGDVRERWHRLARELAEVNLCSLVTARNSIKAKDRPPVRLLEDAEDEILALADRCVALAVREGLVEADLTGARYFGGLLAVTRPLTVPFEEVQPGHREWLLDVYVRGLRPE